ncbi:hypothetical protein GQ43DRAFT_467654 [Delitschia confertaspora ATCC 74209]|uniref:Vacuolar ATPase assembly protein VMA22 n=1 Tax=Delitschia confertaspora ATCC 74209 TaxID=1513339 RepID=A0A9P4JWY0_9PLEO|nr:hypothetical protein GQ43DRAFT_467654 [Delitschia confertaspora ATCC 74209]
MGTALRAEEKEILLSRLDDLLEHYLNTLDQYQKAQEQLSKQLASAHMSLAHAQFNNNSHTRYGQDYYDGRMQASRKTTITEDDSKITFSISHKAPQADAESVLGSKKHIPEEPKDAAAKSDTETKSSPEAPRPKNTDPLRWFGILVPPTLRAAQISFISVVEGSIPQLASLTKDLRRLEIDIGRLRKQIKKL